MQQRLDRERAQRGDVTASLAWDTRDDLDFWIHCPNGNAVTALSPTACGGRLDIDANGSGNPPTARPVENIYFARVDSAPPGRYRVEIDNFRGGAQRWRVRVTIRGRVCDFEGAIGPTPARVTVTEFTLPDGDVRGCRAAR